MVRKNDIIRLCEAHTDFRRGPGTFAKVEQAMEILRECKLLFGISCCYTSKNVVFSQYRHTFNKKVVSMAFHVATFQTSERNPIILGSSLMFYMNSMITISSNC